MSLKLDRDIGQIVKKLKGIGKQAVAVYGQEINQILDSRCQVKNRIEHSLDGMLDFCFDDGAQVLYKKLCRYYYDIDPEATVSYVHAYREMWDERKPDKCSLDGEPRHKPDKRDKLPPKTKGATKGPKGS